MANELDTLPTLGTKVLNLTVKYPAPKDTEPDLATGLQGLYRTGKFADVSLVCAGQTFPAHRLVLAAKSPAFCTALADSCQPAGGCQEIRVAEVDNPEAVKIMLDFMYEVVQNNIPRARSIIKDVLRLAHNFQLPVLTQHATQWLSQDITTGNVVEVLAICEDFSLTDLRDRILSQLTHNKKALAEVAGSPQIMSYPKLMQSLLCQAAVAPEPQPKKKIRKGTN